jgi:large-conductance mechanosensitive channel
MSNSSRKIKAESNGINTKWVLLTLISVVLIVIVFYFVNFNSHLLKGQAWWGIFQNFSNNTGTWGAFGDYVGGILNPVIAAFAFYLIAKTYELQKRELEATRSLLEVSTDAQQSQIKLAALTALLNSNLTRIGTLKAEVFSLNQRLPELEPKTFQEVIKESLGPLHQTKIIPGLDGINSRVNDIENEIEKLEFENISLEEQIKKFFELKPNI